MVQGPSENCQRVTMRSRATCQRRHGDQHKDNTQRSAGLVHRTLEIVELKAFQGYIMEQFKAISAMKNTKNTARRPDMGSNTFVFVFDRI